MPVGLFGLAMKTRRVCSEDEAGVLGHGLGHRGEVVAEVRVERHLDEPTIREMGSRIVADERRLADDDLVRLGTEEHLAEEGALGRGGG